ncbi:MAG: hypothetical protein FJX57_21520 [Alphaproteobacteria bacterium]|nr:hypothetical protein [Alphaproteobacteria bacterium]
MGGISGPEVALAWSFKHFIWALTRSRKLGRLAGVFLGLLLRPLAGLMAPASMFDASSATFFLGAKDEASTVTHKELLTLYRGQFASSRMA